jgi:hypothetical protein
MGHGMAGRWGSDFTPGWSMMTPQERDEHRNRMRAMTDHADCTAYMEHRQQMLERAKKKGRTMPAEARRDACASLKR